MKETMTNSKKDMNERARAAKKVKDERAKKRSSRQFGPWNREGQSIPTVTGAGDRCCGSRKPGNCYKCRESGHWQREFTAKITKISNMLYNLLPCTVCKYLTKGRGHEIRKSACQSFDKEFKCDHWSFRNVDEVNKGATM